MTYSSTACCGNWILSSCLAEPERDLMIHKNRAIVRTMVKAVCLVAATRLLLPREGGVFMAGTWMGV